MYQALSVFSGAILALMIVVNGGLSERFGSFNAAVIIHIVGSLFAFIFYLFQKEKQPLFRKRPRWLYLGGVVGVATTIFSNLAFGKISVTSIIALELLGQTVTSLLIDSIGLLGMPKRPFKKHSLVGLLFSIIGVYLMMDHGADSGFLAMLFALSAGVSVIIARTINGELSEKIGPMNGSLVNHLMGLPVTLVLATLVGESLDAGSLSSSASPVWLYFGGIFGVLLVYVTNIVVPKISAFQVTILAFIGQIFTGIFLDQLFAREVSSASFRGGLVISLGMALNILIEKFFESRSQNSLTAKKTS